MPFTQGMGSSTSKVFSPLLSEKEMIILILGLDNAGKTTILQRMNLGNIVVTIPTIGMNVESLKLSNITFYSWELGGADKIRPLWRHFYENALGIVFVVDSVDRERIEESRDELRKLLVEEKLRECPVLVLANKQDDPRAMSLSMIAERLRLSDIHSHKLHLQGSSGATGIGVNEGFEWLVCMIEEKLTSST